MIAYQGAGRVLSPAEVEEVARWATEDLRPDLTVVLDVEPGQAVGVHRRQGPAGGARATSSTNGSGSTSSPWPRGTRTATWWSTPGAPAADIAADIQARVAELLSYRPGHTGPMTRLEPVEPADRVWAELIGQSRSVEVLRRAVAGEPHAMSHAWLITGPPGSGRSNAARAFAAALQCERGRLWRSARPAGPR